MQSYFSPIYSIWNYFLRPTIYLPFGFPPPVRSFYICFMIVILASSYMLDLQQS
jgi:hypothetical protein